MERSSILIDQRCLDFNLYYTEKTPEYLCENCGVILCPKQALKCHMVTKHSEKVMTYQCSKCPMTCNRLDNMRCHIKNILDKEIPQELSCMRSNRCPQSQQRPKRQKSKTTPVITRPYFNPPTSSNEYVYQQLLRPNQRPIPWRPIPIDIPEKTTRKDVPPNPKDP